MIYLRRGERMKKNLNSTMLNLMGYIKDFQMENSYFPTVREMAKFLNVKSTCTISYYIEKLCEKGLLKKHNSKSRALEILMDESKWSDILQVKIPNSTKISFRNSSSFYHEDTIDIPLVGTVTAGQPILAVEEYGNKWTLPYEIFNKNNLFILDVQGESMINAGILNGDKIVVLKQNIANNGEIVVALIDDSATVKRFYKENGLIRLQPENDSMSPMYFENVVILGKVIGLIRNI